MSISDIMFGFYDGVLWFIKVLVFLYASFFIFSIVLASNEKAAWTILITLTLIIMGVSYNALGTYTAPGIPFFTIGVLASKFKNVNWRRINISILPVIAYGIIRCFQGGIYTIVILLVAVIMLFLMLLRPRLNCPSLLAALSFDIYLVHNKVLMIGRLSDEAFPVLEFLIITIFATLVFHVIHNYANMLVNNIIPRFKTIYETRL